MSLERLHSRFQRLQGMQNEFLSRIKEYRLTKDPSLLPAVAEADRLDTELKDIARELSDTDSDESGDEDFGVPPKTKATTEEVVKIPEKLVDLPQPTIEEGHTLEELPPDRSSPVIHESKETKPDDDASANSPGSRRRKRMDSFVVVSDASAAVAKSASPPPATTIIPSFGEVIKQAVDEGELSLPDNESSAPETFDEPPPTYRREEEVQSPGPTLSLVPTQSVVIIEEQKDLTYISPTPPASPPPVVVPTVLSPPPAVVSTPQSAHQSPLGRSNDRRKLLPQLSKDPTKYWLHVRAERERMGSILALLKQLDEVQSEIRKDFVNIKVRPIGITGEYLFTKRAVAAPTADEPIPDPPPQPVEVPEPETMPEVGQPVIEAEKPVEESEFPSSSTVAMGMFNSWISQFTSASAEPRPKAPTSVIWATVTIQKWFKKWSARRKEKLASLASMAEAEAVASREALRKRRRERRGGTNRDAYAIQQPVLDEVIELIE
jgi:hypothetical protein